MSENGLKGELIDWNNTKIKELNGLYYKYKKDFEGISSTAEDCLTKLNTLRDAWCGLPFGSYADGYFQTLQRPPPGYEFNVEWGTTIQQPEGWVLLEEKSKRNFEKKLPKKKDMEEKIEVAIVDIKELVSRQFNYYT